MISATAPGKVMLWGEYAVLTGAPAAMLAVDRYARCTIEPQPSGWSVQTPGFADESLTLTHEELLNTPATGARALQQALLVLADNAAQVPSGGSVILDTREFHYNQHKLGIGSSAAIATATCQAVATLLSCDASFAKARQVHDQLQGKRGSGADVAAAWFGGALRYQEGQATPLSSIALSNWSFWWTGQAASTSAHVQRFQRWSAASNHAPLDALADASCALFECVDAITLRRYIDCLRALDVAAQLGIYSPAHTDLHQLAIANQVVYKPCGAGGGDVGAAYCADAAALAAFASAAQDQGYLQLDLARSEHGVYQSR